MREHLFVGRVEVAAFEFDWLGGLSVCGACHGVWSLHKIEKEKETLSKQLDDETKKYDSQKEKVQQILKRKDDEISLYEQKVMDLDEQLGELPELGEN